MEYIISPSTLSLADMLKAVHKFDTVYPFGHFVAQLIFYPQPQRRSMSDR